MPGWYGDEGCHIAEATPQPRGLNMRYRPVLGEVTLRMPGGCLRLQAEGDLKQYVYFVLLAVHCTFLLNLFSFVAVTSFRCTVGCLLHETRVVQEARLPYVTWQCQRPNSRAELALRGGVRPTPPQRYAPPLPAGRRRIYGTGSSASALHGAHLQAGNPDFITTENEKKK